MTAAQSFPFWIMTDCPTFCASDLGARLGSDGIAAGCVVAQSLEVYNTSRQEAPCPPLFLPSNPAARNCSARWPTSTICALVPSSVPCGAVGNPTATVRGPTSPAPGRGEGGGHAD